MSKIKITPERVDAPFDNPDLQVAVLDRRGTIVSVNDGWRRFADENDLGESGYGVGTNYIDVCEAAAAAGDGGAAEVVSGIRDMIAGTRSLFVREYTCHSPEEQRWMRLTLRSVNLKAATGGVVAIHMPVGRPLRPELLDRIRQDRPVVSETLLEAQRQILFIQRISDIVLESLDADEIYDRLAERLVNDGVFRSIMIADVDRQAETVEVVRAWRWDADRMVFCGGGEVGLNYDLNDANVTAQVARTGEGQIIASFDDNRLDRRVDNDEVVWGDRVAFFIPVGPRGATRAVLATGCNGAEVDEMKVRIEALQPLLVHVAIALNHARLFREREEARDRAILQERLVRSMQDVAGSVLQDMNEDRILQRLADEIVERRMFRSVTLAVTDEEKKQITIRLNRVRACREGAHIDQIAATGVCYSLDDDGVIAEVARTGKMVTIESHDDPRLDRRFDKDEVTWRNKIAYFVPIKSDLGCLGVLATGSYPEEREVTLDQIRALEPLLEQVTAAVHHARISASLRRANEELMTQRSVISSLLDVGGKVLEDLSEEAILDGLAEEMRAIGLFRGIGLSLIDPVNRVLRAMTAFSFDPDTGSWHSDPEQSTAVHDLDGPDIQAIAARTGEIQIADRPEDVRLDPRLLDASSWVNKVAYFVPIQHAGRAMAVFSTGSTEEDRPQTLERIAALQPLFGQVAIALHHARQFEELRASRADHIASESRLRSVFETSGVGMAFVSPSGVYTEVNPAFSRMLGYAPEELLGRTPLSLTHPDDLEATRQQVLAVQRGDVEGLSTFETRYLHRDGSSVWALVTPNVVRGPDGSLDFAVTVIRDISAQKAAEADVLRTARLHLAAQLSAGISHNLNNILTSILGPAQMLLRMEIPEAARDEAEAIVNAARRAGELVNQLHESTRSQESFLAEPVDVNSVIEEAIIAARPKWRDEAQAVGQRIDIETHLGDVPRARAAATAFHDVVINLILNAVDAMPDGGTLSILTCVQDRQICIEVRDTGIGMSSDVRERVFEPFFTSKAEIGTGMGLSTAHGAVTGWGGHIAVDSEPGEGSRFTVLLDPWEGDPPGIAKAGGHVPGARKGRMLVVDDEPEVHRFFSRLFEDHEVVCVPDGACALTEVARGRFDVVLIDLGLPGVPGNVIREELVRADPELVTILVTGWMLDDADPRRAGFDMYLQKPFDDIEVVEDLVAEAVRLRDAKR